MKKRGQAGLEYVMLTGLLLFFFIPLIHYSFEESNNAIKISQIDSYVGRLSKAVDAVHSVGPGAMEVVVVNAPKGIIFASTNNSADGTFHEINLQVNFKGGISDIHAPVKPYIYGNLPSEPGTYHLKVRCLNESAVNISLT